MYCLNTHSKNELKYANAAQETEQPIGNTLSI